MGAVNHTKRYIGIASDTAIVASSCTIVVATIGKELDPFVTAFTCGLALTF